MYTVYTVYTVPCVHCDPPSTLLPPPFCPLAKITPRETSAAKSNVKNMRNSCDSASWP